MQHPFPSSTCIRLTPPEAAPPARAAGLPRRRQLRLLQPSRAAGCHYRRSAADRDCRGSPGPLYQPHPPAAGPRQRDRRGQRHRPANRCPPESRPGAGQESPPGDRNGAAGHPQSRRRRCARPVRDEPARAGAPAGDPARHAQPGDRRRRDLPRFGEYRPGARGRAL